MVTCRFHFRIVIVIIVIITHGVLWLSTAQSELAETGAQLKSVQEQLVKALADVARLSDELATSEQVRQQTDKQRQLLDSQLREAEVKLDAVQTETTHVARKTVDKLEQRVRRVVILCNN